MSYNVPEVYSIETPDGQVFMLNDGGSRFILKTPDGFGLPPLEFDTYRAYKADKITEIGYGLGQRNFVMQYHENTDCRSDLWDARYELLEELRPNRTNFTDRAGHHILTISYDGGQILRSIYCRFTTPVYVSSDDWIEYAISEGLQVICFDPVWFDPTVNSSVITYAGVDELIFPTEFDADDRIFGETGLWAYLTVNYVGSWYSWPTFVFTGPYSGFKLEHLDTGAIIECTASIANGQYITLDIEAISAIRDNGDNYNGFLTPESDFVGFRIEPEAIAPGGVNTIRITVYDSDLGAGATGVTMSYKTRYIGI